MQLGRENAVRFPAKSCRWFQLVCAVVMPPPCPKVPRKMVLDRADLWRHTEQLGTVGLQLDELPRDLEDLRLALRLHEPGGERNLAVDQIEVRGVARLDRGDCG